MRLHQPHFFYCDGYQLWHLYKGWRRSTITSQSLRWTPSSALQSFANYICGLRNQLKFSYKTESFTIPHTNSIVLDLQFQLRDGIVGSTLQGIQQKKIITTSNIQCSSAMCLKTPLSAVMKQIILFMAKVAGGQGSMMVI